MYCSTASEDFFYMKMLVGVERNRLCILFDVAQIFPISARFLPFFSPLRSLVPGYIGENAKAQIGLFTDEAVL